MTMNTVILLICAWFVVVLAATAAAYGFRAFRCRRYWANIEARRLREIDDWGWRE